ncbi:MAG: BON domain-containing protein [Chloroflexi bacterium]|nr:BON domain-containing protein [Chloroflexota bacterium]
MVTTTPSECEAPPIGTPVAGRDGAIGTVVGRRTGGAPPEAAYLLVRQPSRLGLRHTVRLVPMAWVRTAPGRLTPVVLNAERTAVARCQPVRRDLDIRADVLDALAADPHLRPQRLSAIGVAVRDGLVTLTGHVTNATRARAARACAAGVRGVLWVQDETVADEHVIAGVAEALLADPDTRTAHLVVTCRRGQVALSGLLPSEAARTTARTLAGAVPGVAGVRNDTIVRPATV